MCKTERDQQIASLYTSGHSAPSLSRDFSLSVPAIRAIIRAAGVKRMQSEENATVKTKKLRRALSRTHERLGEIVSSFRMLELKQSRREAADCLGWTPHKVASIEGGHFDPTLSDLLDLVGYLKRPIEELIKP
jgi:DNA-binding XRE family transcriptional regulator